MPSTTIEQAIEYRLRADASILAALGGNKVHFVDIPSGTVEPYITFSNVFDDRAPYRLCSDNAGQPRMQIDIWTRNKFQALTIGNLVIASLNFFKGKIDGLVVDWIRCHGVQVIRDESSDDLYHGIVEADILYIVP